MSANTGDLYAVHVLYTTPGGVAENTFGFAARQAVAGDAQTDLANAFRTAMIKNTSGGLLFNMTAGFSCTTIRVEDVKPGTLATVESVAAAVTGNDAGQALPPQNAVVMTLYTASKGRSYRGRVYLPGVSENAWDGSAMPGAVLTNYLTIPTQLGAVFGPGGSNANWSLVVISRYLNKVKRGTPVGTAVTSIVVDPIIHTQRRRVLGVGQ
jgi:hypothetical protein